MACILLVIPRTCARPPLTLRICINTCSIVWLVKPPDENMWLLLMVQYSHAVYLSYWSLAIILGASFIFHLVQNEEPGSSLQHRTYIVRLAQMNNNRIHTIFRYLIHSFPVLLVLERSFPRSTNVCETRMRSCSGSRVSWLHPYLSSISYRVLSLFKSTSSKQFVVRSISETTAAAESMCAPRARAYAWPVSMVNFKASIKIDMKHRLCF